MTAGNLDGATDVLETSVAVDPRNRAAFLLLAQVAESRHLPGKVADALGDLRTMRNND